MSIRNPNGSNAPVLGALLLLVTLPGCISSYVQKPGTNKPFTYVSEIPWSAFEVLGTVEGEGHTQTILCFLKYAKEPESGRYTIRMSWIGTTGGLGLGSLGLKSAAAAATYDALTKVPEADLMLPLTTMTRKNGFGCLWSRETATMRGKAIRIKDSAEHR